ncbi:MAG TPA: hypothetical protein PKY77_19670 [Phycisphaerae bacterium]|nr:hypothetical protein [Phycisphaerae bacterium]HRY70704.1 hypothetical protein [Phycisphaerae bacterium]HSA28701.1 hypothetical protein [Phycisphaerae bacterium]
MKEGDARELAFAIIGDFEELLAENDIRIPSADREGREEEACIYGTEYYLLEDAGTDILVKGSERTGRTPQARDMAFRIIEELEEVLDYHHIKVPSVVSARATSDLALCMPEWDRLRDGIVRLLRREAALPKGPAMAWR